MNCFWEESVKQKNAEPKVKRYLEHYLWITFKQSKVFTKYSYKRKIYPSHGAPEQQQKIDDMGLQDLHMVPI